MTVVTAPNYPKTFERPSIFLGGAITGAPNWQEEAVKLLRPFATCFNPRREEGFLPPEHPDHLREYERQVAWEHHYLLAAEVALFWMPKEALAITTRFEIGWWFGLNFAAAGGGKLPRPLAVGLEPGVKGGTYYQVVLPKLGVPVHSTLEATCEWACKLIG